MSDRSRHGNLVHDAVSSGREAFVTVYLEGGDAADARPIKSRILCHSQEQAAELARVLLIAKWEPFR